MNWLKKYWKWVALGIALVGITVAASFLPVGAWVKGFTDWIRDLGFAGACLFVVVYAVAAVLFLPGAIFTIAAGLIYGIVGGTAVAILGATLGASLAFLIGRYLLRRRIEKLARENQKFGAIDEAVGEQGWKIVGLLRLSPLIPFNLSNYFYGITAIGFWPYLLASFFGMLPGTLLYAYLGAIGRAGLSGGQEGRTPLEWTFLALGLAATIVVTVLVSRVAKKALRKTGAAN